MTRIFKYELKRLLINKFYLCLFAVNGFFAWYILTRNIIAGVAYTAPFSKWSYGAYLSSIMPILIMTVLFLITSLYSKNEKHVELLIKATPVDVIHYTMIRMIVILLGFLLILALVIGISVYFYYSFFNFRSFSDFIIPAVVTILPGLMFFLGTGFCAGRIHIAFLYTFILVLLLLFFTEIPGVFDIFGKYYFKSYPMSPHISLSVNGEPLFVLSPVFLIVRGIYMIIGIALFIFHISRLTRATIR